MNVKIKSASPVDSEHTECVILEVLKDTDIGKYILLDYASHKIIHTFWFPDMQVKKGDIIHLFKVNSPSTKILESTYPASVHKLIWYLPEATAEVKDQSLVLVEANDWVFQEKTSKAA